MTGTFTTASVVCGAVLAGGASRRMGADKAFLDVGGRPMGGRVVDALRGAGCRQVMAVGGDGRLGDLLGVDVVDDRWPGEGPLGGIITAIEHAAGAPVLVIACDLPWITPEVLRTLVDAAGAGDPVVGPGGVDELTQVVVAQTTRAEPLCALWRPEALGPLVAAFEAGERAVHRVLGQLRVRFCDVDSVALRNVNTPDDLALVRRVEGSALRRPGGSVPS